MDADGIIEVCRVFGLNHSRVYENKRRGPHIQISCPLSWDASYHSSNFDTKPSCSVTVDPEGPSKARCHAASCGFKGSFLELVRKSVMIRRTGRINKTLAELVKRVREAESVDLGRLMDNKRKRVDGAPKTLYEAVSIRGRPVSVSEDRLKNMTSDYHPYADFRGISRDSWDKWGLLFDPRRDSLVFPVRMSDGRLVGMVGRSVNDDDNSKKNYPGLDKSSHLYGEQFLRPEAPIVIVEGPIDCVKTDGILGDVSCIVSTLGGGFSDDQSKIIRSMRPSCVYIFPDGDRGGRAIASKIAYVLSRRVILYQMKTPRGEDPASLDADMVLSLYKDATRIKNKILT